MTTDICRCKRERGEHNGTGLNGACLNFQLDRKATWDADTLRAKAAKLMDRINRALGLNASARIGGSR